MYYKNTDEPDDLNDKQENLSAEKMGNCNTLELAEHLLRVNYFLFLMITVNLLTQVSFLFSSNIFISHTWIVLPR